MSEPGPKSVEYVCHPYSRGGTASLAEICANVQRVRIIARELTAHGIVPLAPHLFVPEIVDGMRESEAVAMSICIELVSRCDVLGIWARPCGRMRDEIESAERGEKLVVERWKERDELREWEPRAGRGVRG